MITGISNSSELIPMIKMRVDKVLSRFYFPLLNWHIWRPKLERDNTLDPFFFVVVENSSDDIHLREFICKSMRCTQLPPHTMHIEKPVAIEWHSIVHTYLQPAHSVCTAAMGVFSCELIFTNTIHVKYERNECIGGLFGIECSAQMNFHYYISRQL